MLIKAKQFISVPKYILSEESNRSEKIKRLIFAAFWQLWKRTIKLPIVLPLDNGQQFIAEPKAKNSTGAIYTRIYEYRCIMFARKHVQRGGVICDVGAHTGLYSLLLANLFDKGICFEPADDSFELLRKNLCLNNFTDFELYNKAVSHSNGYVEFNSDGPYSGTAHICDDESQIPPENIINVPSVTLDSVLYERHIEDLHYLKIDAEGHEYSVLQGGLKTIRSNPQLLIHVEITKHMSKIFDLLKNLNFKIFYLDNIGQPYLVQSPPDHQIRFPHHYTTASRGDFIACGPGHVLYNSIIK